LETLVSSKISLVSSRNRSQASLGACMFLGNLD
jgi:hypothetical protein